MLSSAYEEDLIVKWLLAEAIYYKNEGEPVHNPFEFKWASHTRIQKIIFNILDEFDISVTRSWYKWGGFVHSDELDTCFTSLRDDYSRNPERTLGLRQKVQSLGIPIDVIRHSLEKRVDEVISMPSKDFLILYYKNESPVEYRNLYVAKQEMSNFFDDIATAGNVNTMLDKSHKISDDITQFHKTSVTLFDDARLREATFSFTDLIENVLDKLNLLIERKERISKEKLLFFKKSKDVFDDFIWNPYACEISQRTVKGIRANAEKEKMRYQKERKISQTSSELDVLQYEMKERRLESSYEELQAIKKIAFKNETAAKNVSEIIGIYGRGKDGER